MLGRPPELPSGAETPDSQATAGRQARADGEGAQRGRRRGGTRSRMGQTPRLVHPPVLWVVVKAGKPTPEAAAALRRTAVMHRYVGCCDKLAATNASSSVDYRQHQMNAALEMVENHRLDGIVYFADEEGIYSLHLFDRLRQIRFRTQ